MPASQRAKRKEAAGESSGRDPSSSSLSLAFSDIEERSAKKYHTKCQIEKDVIHAAAKRALDAKAMNGGQMPDKWYTKYMCRVVFVVTVVAGATDDLHVRQRVVYVVSTVVDVPPSSRGRGQMLCPLRAHLLNGTFLHRRQPRQG